MIAAESHKNKMENYIVAFYRHIHSQDKRAKAAVNARSKNAKYLRSVSKKQRGRERKSGLDEILKEKNR